MTKYRHLFLWISFIILLSGCGGKKENLSPFSTHNVYKPQYAKGFEINEDTNASSRIIRVYNPWQGAKNVSKDFFILKEGEDTSIKESQKIIDIPQRIVCMSSTHIAFLDALNETDKIIGVSGKKYISNPKIRNSEIPDIGYEGNIDYETLISIKPDIVLLFSVEGATTMEPKLKELGIPYLYIGDYLEESPLGKAEWIVAVAEVLGKREVGISVFKELSNNYETLKAKIDGTDVHHPKVMVNAPFADYWYMPSTESYVAQLIKDAGGDYLYKKDTGNASLPIDKEEALSLVNEADFWINIGTFDSLEEVKNNFPDFNSTKCIKERKLYNNNLKKNAGGGNDCFESGVVHPDLILQDLVNIFHPEFSNGNFTYYHQLK